MSFWTQIGLKSAFRRANRTRFPRMYPMRIEEDPADAFQWRGHFAENQTVAVFGLRGNVQVRGIDGSEAWIRAVKYGDSRDFDRIRIETEHTNAGIVVRVVYPSGTWIGELPEVNFTIDVPARSNFAANIVNSVVNVKAVEGEVTAYVVNGSVTIAGAGSVHASVVNGPVVAMLGETNWQKPVHCSTLKGTIELGIPAGANTGVRLKSAKGKIFSDFALSRDHDEPGTVLIGSIGDPGDRRLTCDAVKGNIHLRRVI